jgi:hypothetical protein
LVIFATACNLIKKDKPVVAEVFEYVLYEADLIEAIPHGLNKEDSLLFVQEYVNQWAYHHALLHRALINDLKLPEDEEKLEKHIQDYKESLVIYRYTQRLVGQKLDTNVQMEEIEAYYHQHPTEFTLKDDIVQVAFVKLYNSEKNIKQVRKLLQNYEPEDIVRLKSIAEDKAVNYFLEDDTWILFDDLVKEIPIQTYNKTLYLQNNKFIELQDSVFTYLLRINDFRVQDSYSPLSFEHNRIRSLIINKRKMELIERMQKDVFNEAQKDGDIIIHEQKTDNK